MAMSSYKYVIFFPNPYCFDLIIEVRLDIIKTNDVHLTRIYWLNERPVLLGNLKV